MRNKRIMRCAYPGLAAWMREHGKRAKDFAPVLYISQHNAWYKLSGTTRLTLEDIRAILDFTGLSFEEAFGENGQ